MTQEQDQEQDNDTAGPTQTAEVIVPVPDATPTRVLRDEADGGDETSGYSAPAEPEDWSGQRLDRYLVLDRIGRGGMGDVLLAYDPELDRRVAIKLIRPRKAPADAEEEQSRLLREAQALAKLSHPNVVAVHDVGTAEGRIYVAMEFVQGLTLQQWLQAARSWSEIASVVAAAGQGLAAAHEQGIVHRDFKPGNVMVGDDGRVRVLDFGLARQIEPPSLTLSGRDRISGDSLEVSLPPDSYDTGPLSESLRSHDRPLTETGTVMGTPAYMAPEQFRGAPVDARSDQFALCVVLYEALYGRRPFSGKTPRELGKAVLRGVVRKPDRGHGVPHRLEAAVLRGLAVAPEDRFESTDAFLAELDKAMRPGRWRPAAALVAVAVAGGAAAWYGGGTPPCQGAQAQIDTTWGETQRDDLGRAFGKTGLPYAAASAERVTAILDRYAQRWVSAHTEACRATRVSGEQSEALMDLRIQCLSLRRSELSALVEHLVAADLKTVENAIGAATKLQPLDPCSDTTFLSAVVAPPTDPETAAAVQAARAQLAEARALSAAGDWAGSAPIAQAVLEQARALNYPALVADSGFVVGSGMDRSGRSEEARAVYVEALRAAAEAGHGQAEAMLLAAMVGNLGYFGSDLQTARDYAEHAHGVLARLGNPPLPTGQLTLNEANMMMRAGKYDDAEALYEAVLRIAGDDEAALMQRLAALTNLAALFGTQSQTRRAAEAGLRAQQTMEAALGDNHPAVGIGLNNLGATMLRLGDREAGAVHLRRSEQILSEAFPAGHPELAKTLHNYGQLLAEGGDMERAEATYRRALKMKVDLLGDAHPSTAHTENNLGNLLREQGKHEPARAHLQRALEIWSAALGEEHPHNAYALSSLGELALAEGSLLEARRLLRRAWKLRKDLEHAGFDRGQVAFSLAKALAAGEDGDAEAARAMAEQAMQDFGSTAAPDPTMVAEVERWLEAQ